ncbi:MAG: cytochrome c oxidase subunit II [Chloroflexi bacterium]|nr:cytochrome c oxidase subunit II [Chloroflexota bacterium]
MRRSIRLKFIPTLFSILALGLLVVTGCSSNSPTWLTPASTNAAMVTNLFNLIFGVSVVVFVIVEVLLVYSVLRFRRKSNDEMPTQIHGNSRLEIAWTLAPAIVLVIVFAFTLQTLNAIEETPANALKVKVTGYQWWWAAEYPELGVTTASELHVPVNQAVSFTLESKDVIHSFWVPELGGKRDVVPGKVNTTWFRPTKVGTFYGQCAEFCGVAHANMRFAIIVETQEDFNKWVGDQKKDPAAPVSDLAKQGEQEFLKGICIACHTVNGTVAKGVAGPNLTHLSSRKTFAGGTIVLNKDNLKAWLKDPQALKPGNLMEAGKTIPRLTNAQINALAEYLSGLK